MAILEYVKKFPAIKIMLIIANRNKAGVFFSLKLKNVFENAYR